MMLGELGYFLTIEHMFGLCYTRFWVQTGHKGGRLIPPRMKGGEAMEVYQAITLMFMFGMFILALLTYLKKK